MERRVGGQGFQSGLREFAVCIRVSSLFPARAPGLRAGKNDVISAAAEAAAANRRQALRDSVKKNVSSGYQNSF